MAKLVMRVHATPQGAAIATLTRARSKHLLVEDNGVGGGGFTINANDPGAESCIPDAYVTVYRDDTDLLGGFFIEDVSDVVLSPDESGGQDITVGGRGSIVYLAEALVWHRARLKPRGMCQPQRRRWFWRKAHPGRVLLRMLREARARGDIPGVTWDFTRTTDSDGSPWQRSEAQRMNIPIGINLLELVDLLRESGLYVTMGGDLVVHAWDDYERDLSPFIELTAGVDIHDTVTRQPRVRRARSHLLVEGESRQGKTRHRVVRLTAVRQALGRRKEGFFRYERTANRRTLRRVGRRKIRRWRREWEAPLALPVLESAGRVALIDYIPGDTVGVHIPGKYDHQPIRIVGITLRDRDGGAGEYDPVLELGAFVTGLT